MQPTTFERSSFLRIPIDRPMATSMLFLAVLMLGLIAVNRMPVALFPTLEGQNLYVNFQRSGSTPELLEREILNKLESRIGSIPDIRETVAEIRGSSGQMQITFDPDTDIKIREYELRRIVSKLQREQPTNTTYLGVNSESTDRFASFVMDVSVVGETSDTDVLFDIASDIIAPRLASVLGVSQATATGGGGRQVIVELDPIKAALLSVETRQISQAIERKTGKLEYLGGLENESGRTPVMLDGRVRDLSTLEETQVGAVNNAKLRHTSDVHFGYARADAFYRVNGRDAVGITIYQESDANLVELGGRLRERIEEIHSEVASMGIELIVLQDSSVDVGDQLTRVTQLGVIGLALALLVLFVFLREWRAVLVVGIAVPVSIVMALSLLYLFGHTINLLTLFGLAVSTGLLVDNSIVVYEAILRGVERNVPIGDAVEKGLRRTIRAIAAASLTTAVVFLPIVIIELESVFSREIIQTVALALLLPVGTSLIVAIGLVPLLAHRLAAPAARKRVVRLQEERQRRGDLSKPNFAKTLLTSIAKNALRFPASWLTGVIFAVVLTIFFAWIPIMGGGGDREAPNADDIELNLRFNYGSRSLDASIAAISRIEAQLLAVEGVDSVTVNGDRRGARVIVNFVDLDERPSTLTTGFIRDIVNEYAKKTRGIDVMGAGEGGIGGSRRGDGKRRDFNMASRAEFVISGPDSNTLQQLAEDIEERLEGSTFVSGSWVAARRGSAEIWVTPNKSALDSLGLKLSDVMSNLNIAGTEGLQMATDYVLPSGREIPIMIERKGIHTEPAIQDLREMRITTPAGALRLDTVANQRMMRPQPTIVHKNGRKEMSVSYVLNRDAPRSGDALTALRDQLNSMVLATPRPSEYVIETPEVNENVSTISKLLIPALLFLLLVLAMTFESLSLPVLVMVSVPLTMLGSGWLLFLSGTPLDVGALIGMLALVGITVNPAILLVDRMQRRTIDAGWSRGAAALATVRERTRPVLLVTATTIAALAPLAISTGRENELWPGFAMTVIGGLVSSALLTLLVIPVGYILLHRLDSIFGRIGPWLMVAWVGFTGVVMSWLIWNEFLVSLLWQVVVTLLIAGLLLTLIVLIFRRVEHPEPRTDGGPPVLEVKHLGKFYGLPGPVKQSIAEQKNFIELIRQRSGVLFSRWDAVERSITTLIIAGMLIGVSYFTIDNVWGLITALGASVCVALTLNEVRRLLGQIDSVGLVRSNGLFSFLNYLLPWFAIAVYVYFANVIPIQTGEEQEMPLVWPIVVGVLLLVCQLMRRTAVKQLSGEVDERARGFLRYPRTLTRKWARQLAGFDVPSTEVEAFSGVEFTAKKGMIGLLGPNGAGKTTLLRQLAGILDPTTGVITLGGVPIKSIQKQLARWIGYLPQDAGLPHGSTPKAYLMYYAALYELPAHLREERVDSLLGEVGLTGKEDDKIGSLSGGMRQRVAVARTLLRLPPIIIVDEPTVGLDPRERIRFRNLLSRLAEDRIVLFSTHVVDDVAVACDRVLVMGRNRLLFDGAPGDLSTHAEGKVWQFEQDQYSAFDLPADSILADEAPSAEGTIRRRVLSKDAPSEKAETRTATLEDGYLWLISGFA